MKRDPREPKNISLDEGGHGVVMPVVCFLKRPWVLFGVVLLVSACCKLLSLNSRELWLDETYSAFVANLPLAELPRHLAGEYNPPFFYILLWAWVHIVGDVQAHLRLFSVVLNICSMFGMYVLARRMLGARFGALAAVLFAFSPMLFVYSLEVRNYMLFILIFICLLVIHWMVAIERREEKWLILAYGILAALLFYTSYIAVFILLGLCVHGIIASGFDRGRLGKLCVTGILIIVFIAPGIPALLERNSMKTHLGQALALSHQNANSLSFGVSKQESAALAGTGIKGMAKSAAAASGLYPSSSPFLLLLCALPLVFALAGAVYLGVAKGDEACRLFGILLIAVGIGLVVLHLYATRYMLPVVPLLVIAIARAVQYGRERLQWRVFGLAVGVMIFCLYSAGFFRQVFFEHGRPWQNLVGAIQQNYRPGDEVIFDVLYSQVPFDYFAQQANFQPQETGFPISIYDWWNKQSNKAWGGPVITNTDLNDFVSGLSSSRPKRLWLVLYETYYYDPHEELLDRLHQLGQVTEVHLPPDRDKPDKQETLRLFRIALQ